MGKKQEQDLRIMEQVHSSLLDTIALRDAEIEVLREKLREMVAERDAEIAQLNAQVAELQAWKDAVPVDAITEIWYSAYARTGGNDDSRTVAKWFASIGVVTSD